LTIFTIGHSTHTFEEFVEFLRAYGIRQLIDVRTVPRSRHNPQFNKDTLGKALRNRRINYRHMKDLGGLRHVRADSTLNLGWRNASFRGYADYMQTAEFAGGLSTLIGLAAKGPTAIMCAEAVPWRCHRSMIGDALVARGIAVQDVFSPTSIRAHALNKMAKVHGDRLTYPLESRAVAEVM
jgi:uncharacterized protein (DUF488 family)